MKFRKKEVKNTGVASRVFTKFLSNSPATGKKYTAIESCWKRKPKLDYLDLDGIKEGKDKGEAKRKSSKEEVKKPEQRTTSRERKQGRKWQRTRITGITS
eukprot:2027107-Ditylum_brightwellii.AAC.1